LTNKEHTFEGSLLIKRLGGVETEIFCELAAVLCILMDTKLNVLAKGLPELVVIVFVLGDLTNEVKCLLDKILTNNLQNLILLKSLTGNVERKILRINDTLDKVKVLRDELLAVIHDEHTADVELDVVTLLLLFEEIERSTEETVQHQVIRSASSRRTA